MSNEFVKVFEKYLQNFLKTALPKHQSSNVYEYCLLPLGKAFRPQLAAVISQDLKLDINDPNLLAYCCFLEIHHAYTLVHDDLPCMDDDDFRRGKPSCHKHFSEWQAVLAGDALLNLSYEALGQIESPNLYQILRTTTRFTGGKGLILGQVLDLSEEMNDNFDKLLETHKYKTARLMQLALVGPTYLTFNQDQLLYKDLLRLGEHIGIVFQLYDDLLEFEDELSRHESNVNPFLRYEETPFRELFKRSVDIARITEKWELTHCHNFISNYLKKSESRVRNIKKMPDKNLAFLEKYF